MFEPRNGNPAIWFFFNSATRPITYSGIRMAGDDSFDKFANTRALHGHSGVIVRGIGELQFIFPAEISQPAPAAM